MRNIKAVGIGVAGVSVALVTASLGFIAGRVVSPAQRAAMAAPPPVTVATAKAERRVLNHTTVARGVVRFPSQQVVVLPAGPGVVTHTTLKAGKHVKVGSVLVEVNGHPVVAFASPFPPFRDLKAGDSGRDVQVVKTALKAMALPAASRYATLQSTELSALDRFLQKRGYRLPITESGCPVASEGSADAGSCAPTKKLYLPASWWAGIADLPTVIASPGPVVGQSLGGDVPALTVSGGRLSLEVTFPGEAADVRANSAIRFVGDDQQDRQWTVDSVEDLKQTDDGSGPQLRVRTVESIDPALVEVTGKVTFGSTEPTPLLSVPLTALVAGSSGEVAVRVLGAGGEQVEVPVQVGVQADGWAAVTDESGTLTEGVEVVLG